MKNILFIAAGGTIVSFHPENGPEAGNFPGKAHLCGVFCAKMVQY